MAKWTWLFPAPGGPAPGTAAGEHLWPRWSCWIGHSHVYRGQPFPGAPAYAYEALGLSEFTPIGPGTVNREQMRSLAGLSAFASLGLMTHGVGGLVQGQYASAPLSVTGATPPPINLPYDPLDLYAPPEDFGVGFAP